MNCGFFHWVDPQVSPQRVELAGALIPTIRELQLQNEEFQRTIEHLERKIEHLKRQKYEYKAKEKKLKLIIAFIFAVFISLWLRGQPTVSQGKLCLP